jgi:glycosyltransferase involved in cell wall biosynthesis
MTLSKTLKKQIKNSLFTAKTRKKVKAAESFSTQHIKPVAPWLHSFVFKKLKRYIKQRAIRGLVSFATTEGVNLSELFTCEEEKRKIRTPLVSVIVPNYNHESFLRQRLESIYGQTYRNFEVILMDDKSNDRSVDILEEYVQRYPDKTQLIVNKVNSGGVFHQWKRGIESAQGELIWIAESDDFCSLDLLEKLIPFFDDDSVMLAYAKSIFVQDGKEVWSINEYLSDIDTQLWNQKFVSSAHALVNEAWSLKNILPNASSAIFKNPKGIKLLDDPVWQSMRICGDWVFYLHIIRGGLVGYTPEATNYYRLHSNNTSVATYAKNVYYQEHQHVAITLCELYQLRADVLEKQRKLLKNHWDTYMHDKNDDDFLSVYDLAKVQAHKKERKPNIMMVTFALAAGGGETLPIKIANMLSATGYGVTMVSLEQDDENPGIRSMLASHIPLLKINCLERIEAIAISLGIEIIHSHHAWADLSLAALLQENRTIKMVISTHGMYEMMSKAEFQENFILLNSRIDKIIYTAEKNLAPFLSVPNRNNLLIKIGNALEASEITPASRSEFGINETSFVLCLVSRAIPEKGWEEAIKSVQKARAISNADIHLLLIGEGPEYTRLKSIISEKYIHFCGFKSNIRDYFALADLGFLPSRFEGESFPLVIIDCLYANRPVLASSVGEIPSMLTNGDQSAGLLFDLENMQIPLDTVASMIAKFAIDKEFYQECCMAIPTIILKYDPKEMIRNYDAVYTEIIQKRVL